MRKKLRFWSLGELQEMCRSRERCDGCPFDNGDECWVEDNITYDYLDEEIGDDEI